MRERFEATTSDAAVKKMVAMRLSHAGRKATSSGDEKASEGEATAAPSTPGKRKRKTKHVCSKPRESSSKPRESKTKHGRLKRRDSETSSTTSESGEVEFQESGSSILREELEEMQAALSPSDEDSPVRERTPKKARRVPVVRISPLKMPISPSGKCNVWTPSKVTARARRCLRRRGAQTPTRPKPALKVEPEEDPQPLPEDPQPQQEVEVDLVPDTDPEPAEDSEDPGHQAAKDSEDSKD